VDGKSNEITAVPLLLLNLKGAVVTLDAMGTRDADGSGDSASRRDYVLALKRQPGNSANK